MVRRHEDRSDEETPARQRRKSDPSSIVGFAFRILNEQTPLALIAILALAFMGWLYITTLTPLAQELRDHTRESGWYQRQSCISLAQLAGTAPTLCDQPRDDRR